jgi:hypothetical protein
MWAGQCLGIVTDLAVVIVVVVVVVVAVVALLRLQVDDFNGLQSRSITPPVFLVYKIVDFGVLIY